MVGSFVSKLKKLKSNWQPSYLRYGCLPIEEKTVLYNTNTLENLTMGTAKAYLAVAMLLPISVAVCGAVVLIRRKNR